MKKCALVIGHKKSSPGAVNEATETTEFVFNDRLSLDIESKVNDVYVQRVYRRTYNSLPSDINELDPDFIISLHCNAFNKKASGTEVLCYHRSTKGNEIASILQTNLLQALGLPDRGIKARTTEDRGGYLLRYTNAPCVIAEPFFIDNDEDFTIAMNKREDLVKAYADAISSIALNKIG